MESGALHPLADAGDRRLIRNRAVGIRPGVARLGAVEAERAAHPIERLRARVPGLQLFVPERPARRRPFAIGDGREILGAIADQHGAIELRIAADVVVIAGMEGVTRPVDPRLFRPEDPTLKDGARVARVGGVRKPLAALQNENARAGRRETRRRRSRRPCPTR